MNHDGVRNFHGGTLEDVEDSALRCVCNGTRSSALAKIQILHEREQCTTVHLYNYQSSNSSLKQNAS